MFLLVLPPLLLFSLSSGEAASGPSSNVSLASMLWTRDEGLKLVDGAIVKGAVAWATFEDRINETGWSFLEIETSPDFPDKIQVTRAMALAFADLTLVLFCPVTLSQTLTDCSYIIFANAGKIGFWHNRIRLQQIWQMTL